MDATHLHLILTHFPIVGTIIGAGILAYGIYSGNEGVKKTALSIFVLMALTSVVVYLTGEQAEETVEHLTGVSERAIENHEELAEKAIWLMAVLGALSLINLFAITRKLSFTKNITLITLVMSLATFGLFAKVGNLGGQIRHTEIRSNHTNMDKAGIEKDNEAYEHEEHDDDDDD